MRPHIKKNSVTKDMGVEMKVSAREQVKNTTRHYLLELRTALEDGWQIVQPVFARPLWSSINDEQQAFHFVLQREKATRLMTVPEGRSIIRLIKEQSWSIDKRS